MRILTWYDKHVEHLYEATGYQLDAASLTVLQARLDQGYLFYPDDAEEKARAILNARDGQAAFAFLRGRNDHEYERIEISQEYRPVDTEEAANLSEYIRTFTLEGETYWRDLFLKNDTNSDGSRYHMYEEGDELAPFFTEAFLYNLLGKDEARSVLGIIRRLSVLAGVEYR